MRQRGGDLDAAWDLVRTKASPACHWRSGPSGRHASPVAVLYFGSSAIYDAMFAQGARTYLDEEVVRSTDPLADLQAGVRFFVGSARWIRCASLMFQRTIRASSRRPRRSRFVEA